MPADALPFDLWDRVPAALASVIPNVNWSRERLHLLELPVVSLRIDDLRWQLDLPWWRGETSVFQLTPNDVRRSPTVHAAQWKRTHDANLAYPIHVLQRDRLIILDGVHRLLKSDLNGLASIRAHIVSHDVFVEHVIDR
jgi:hypothetical protein